MASKTKPPRQWRVLDAVDLRVMPVDNFLSQFKLETLHALPADVKQEILSRLLNEATPGDSSVGYGENFE